MKPDAGHQAAATTEGSDSNHPGANRPAPLVRHPDILVEAKRPVRGRPAAQPTRWSCRDQPVFFLTFYSGGQLPNRLLARWFSHLLR